MRAAALLHDIGKLDISRELLYKAARLTEEEFKHMQEHVSKGVSILEPVGGSLRRVIPIVLSHHDKFDGSGYTPTRGDEIPLEARIITVADVYDSLTSDRPYRKAMSPFDAKEIIVKGSGSGLRSGGRRRVRRSVPQGRARSADRRGVDVMSPLELLCAGRRRDLLQSRSRTRLAQRRTVPAPPASPSDRRAHQRRRGGGARMAALGAPERGHRLRGRR